MKGIFSKIAPFAAAMLLVAGSAFAGGAGLAGFWSKRCRCTRFARESKFTMDSIALLSHWFATT